MQGHSKATYRSDPTMIATARFGLKPVSGDEAVTFRVAALR